MNVEAPMRACYHGPIRLLALTSLLIVALSAQAPAQAAELTVTSPADSGPGTLRALLAAANPLDTIRFSPAAFPPGAPTSIHLTTPLPTIIDDNLTIDASDTGVVLEGWLTPPTTFGLRISADGVRVQGLAIIGFSSSGILIEAGSVGTVIGGDRGQGSGPYGRGNRLSRNTANGLEIRGPGTAGTQVLGNWIGLSAAGSGGEGNGNNGVSIFAGAMSTTVGGVTAGLRNTIGGNGGNGILISGSGTNDSLLIGNYIGVESNGAIAAPNGRHGVELALRATASSAIVSAALTATRASRRPTRTAG
jgi:hypothetical protein